MVPLKGGTIDEVTFHSMLGDPIRVPKKGFPFIYILSSYGV